MHVNSCNWPLPSDVVRHPDFQRGFDCSISLEVFTSYVDSLLSARGSNLHVCKSRQNSDISAISPEYPIKKDLLPGIEAGEEMTS